MIDRLEAALKENPPLREILERFDEVDLPDAWLVAGVVAQTVWNLSAGYRPTGASRMPISFITMRLTCPRKPKPLTKHAFEPSLHICH